MSNDYGDQDFPPTPEDLGDNSGGDGTRRNKIPSEADWLVRPSGNGNGSPAFALFQFPSTPSEWMARANLSEEEVLGISTMMANHMAISQGWLSKDSIVWSRIALGLSIDGEARNDFLAAIAAERRDQTERNTGFANRLGQASGFGNASTNGNSANGGQGST